MPSIALGWDWGGFPPPALPRALGRSCAWGSRVGGGNPNPKMGAYFRMIMIDVM